MLQQEHCQFLSLPCLYARESAKEVLEADAPSSEEYMGGRIYQY